MGSTGHPLLHGDQFRVSTLKTECEREKKKKKESAFMDPKLQKLRENKFRGNAAQ